MCPSWFRGSRVERVREGEVGVAHVGRQVVVVMGGLRHPGVRGIHWDRGMLLVIVGRP